jgi:hypothetical protein
MISFFFAGAKAMFWFSLSFLFGRDYPECAVLTPDLVFGL